jgi:hypothetical protein
MTIVKEQSLISFEVDQNLPPQVISAFFGAQLTRVALNIWVPGRS